MRGLSSTSVRPESVRITTRVISGGFSVAPHSDYGTPGELPTDFGSQVDFLKSVNLPKRSVDVFPCVCAIRFNAYFMRNHRTYVYFRRFGRNVSPFCET